MAIGNITAGSQVKFLLGSQSNLEKYISGQSSPQEGAFYLTNDTHRLYVGYQGKVLPVNEGVTTVSTIDDLKKVTNPHPGEFYYVSNGNILCVYSGANGWVQINNNSNTYLTDTDTQISLSEKVATITTVYTDNTGTTDLSEALTDSWKLAVAGGLQIAVDEATDKITLTAVYNDSFGVEVKDNVATVSLKDSFDDKVSFQIKSKQSSTLTIEQDGEAIALEVKDMSNTGLTIDAVEKGFVISVHDRMGAVANEEGTFDPHITVGASGVEAKKKSVRFVNGTADLPVYTKEEIDDIKLALNAMTYRGLVGANASGTTQKAWSVVRAGSAEIGDTYLFAEAVTIPNVGTYSKGTLAIARGVENADGIIPAGNVIWDFVESTVDVDTKYSLNNVASTTTTPGYVQLVGKVSGRDVEEQEKVTFKSGTAINANVSVDNDGNAEVQFNHVGITAAELNTNYKPTDATQFDIKQQAATYDENNDRAEAYTTIHTLESIAVNAQGHVTGFTTKKVQLKDTNAKLESVSIAVGEANKASSISITESVTLKDGANANVMRAKSGAWNLTSETMVFTRDNANTVKVDIVWGSFA